MKRQRQKLLALLLISSLINMSCSSMPKSYDEAELALQSKDVVKASDLLEKADKEKKGDKDIEEKLATVNLQAIDKLLPATLALPEQDLNNRVDKLESANRKIGKVISINQKKHAELKADGPSMMESLSLKLNSKYQTKEMVLAKEIKSEQEKQKKIATYLKEAKAQQEKVEKATDKLLAQSEKKPAPAWDGFQEYLPFAAYMPTIKNKGETVQERLVDQYFDLGMKELSKNKVKPASKYFEEGIKVNPSSNKPQAGVHLANSVKAEGSKQYRDAYMATKQAEGLLPENNDVIEYKKRMAKSLVKDEWNKVTQFSKAAPISQNVQGFESLSILEALAPELDPLLGEKLAERVPVEKNKLRMIMAKKLVAQAEKWEKKDKIAYSGLILTNYQLAHVLAPSSTDKKEERAMEAFAILNKKDAMRVLLYDSRNHASKDMTDAEITISEALTKELGDLKGQSISNLRVQTRDDLPSKKYKNELKDKDFLNDKTLPYSFAEVVIKHQVNGLKFEESGRDQPRQKSSQFISGQRWVHNPEYDRAYSNWQSEENSYRYQAQQREQALRSCDQMNNAFAQGICRGAIQGLSSYSRDQAHAVLNNTPREISENIISNYRYTTYTIKVKGKVVADVNIIDKRLGVALPAQKFEVEVDKEGIINEDVEATDQNGIVAGQFNVPDLIGETDKAKKDLAFKIASSIKEALTSHYYNRFCQQAEGLVKKKQINEAAESLIMCQTLAKKMGKEIDPTLAEKIIAESVGIGQDKARQYAWQEIKTKETEDQPKDDNQRIPASATDANALWPPGSKDLKDKTLKDIEQYINKR